MGRIEVGTASWTDESLIKCGRFYPKKSNTPEERLRYYASVFPCVEVDSSYYALPSSANSEKWAERTPDDFHFNVKAFRLFTGHQTPAAALPKDMRTELAAHFATKKTLYYKDTPRAIRDELWRRFERGIQPLRDAGKLIAVHFQFPPWVFPAREWHDHIMECRDRMADYQIALEFRQEKWFDHTHRDATLAFERTLKAAHVVLDMPQGFSNSLPQIWEVTSPDLAIVRFHGRNKETWNAKGVSAASDRFNYDYPQHELAEFAPHIRALAEQTKRVQAIFNNNFEDQGQRNAQILMELL